MAWRCCGRLFAPARHLQPLGILSKPRFCSSVTSGSSDESGVSTTTSDSSVSVAAPVRPVGSASLKLLTEMRSRGMCAMETNELNSLFAQGQPIVVYGGIDPTADSLHVGHLLLLATLLRFHSAGHEIICVIGGATAIVGDPSGHVNDRPSIPKDEIAKNVESLTDWVTSFFERNRQTRARIQVRNNIEWYKDMGAMELFEEYGRHMRLTTMLSREVVDSRIRAGSGLSYTEFSYQLFQAIDFHILHTNHNVSLQVGGSDQWGNILSGVHLIKAKLGISTSVHGLTLPLITDTLGNKIGKSAGNAVWLERSKTTPFQLYQFFLSTTDAMVDNYLNVFTSLPVADIRLLSRMHKTEPDSWKRQKILAKSVVKLLHGDHDLSISLEATEILYNSRRDVRDLTEDMLEMLFSELPSKEYPFSAREDADIVLFLLQLRILKKKTAPKHVEEMLNAGKIRINGTPITTVTDLASLELLHGRYSLIKHGKRTFCLVRWTEETKEIPTDKPLALEP